MKIKLSGVREKAQNCYPEVMGFGKKNDIPSGDVGCAFFYLLCV
ncbi:MAG: hypothetical protein RIN56_06285 [Sporomusaceae bacterium]|nr:hypothetical protein [Sporomusaceae bacterium]